VLDGVERQELVIKYAGGKELKLETGEIGRLASGSVMLTSGDTMLYTNVCIDPETKGDGHFVPLQVVYHERMSASGRTQCASPLVICRACRSRIDALLALVSRSYVPKWSELLTCRVSLASPLLTTCVPGQGMSGLRAASCRLRAPSHSCDQRPRRLPLLLCQAAALARTVRAVCYTMQCLAHGALTRPDSQRERGEGGHG
jgi:hypothetical protein